MKKQRPKPNLPWAANIPNALDLSVYPCKPHRGDYLLFLGRMSHDKGAHRAIAVAMELGLPLKMAGKNREPKEQQYFERHADDARKLTGERPEDLQTSDAELAVWTMLSNVLLNLDGVLTKG